MTVAQLRTEMPNTEFVEWAVYLGRKQQKRQLAEMKAKTGRR